jgi:sn-glycerol 3-phosphate transport system ATP-binding protein
MASIRLEHVSKEFVRGVEVLRDINLDVADREVLTIVGPSGCGKSTLLRIIAGLDSPTTGEVFIDDCRVNGISARDRNVAMVFQSYALYPHMTCYENLALNLKLKKCSEEEIHRRVQRTAEMLEIESLLDKKPRALSGGQRQRMAVGRALVRDPQAFLLDEPLSSLDAQLRERVRHELKELFTKVQAAVVYVTHDQIEAMTLANRVVVLNKGCVQQVGTPDELYRFPANYFVASFIGSPSMNLLDVHMSDGKFRMGGAEYSTGVHVSGPVSIGIRPEFLRIGAGMRGKVSWIENLGAHFLVGARVDEFSLVLLAAERPSSEFIDISINGAQIHVFEKTSGRNLRLGGSSDPADCELTPGGHGFGSR